MASETVSQEYGEHSSPVSDSFEIDLIPNAGVDAFHPQNAIANFHISEFRQSAATGYGRLTNREREVLTLIVNGHSNKSVARLLDISPRTAEKHRKAVFAKFDTSDLTLLVRYSIVLGIPFELPDRQLNGMG